MSWNSYANLPFYFLINCFSELNENLYKKCNFKWIIDSGKSFQNLEIVDTGKLPSKVLLSWRTKESLKLLRSLLLICVTKRLTWADVVSVCLTGSRIRSSTSANSETSLPRRPSETTCCWGHTASTSSIWSTRWSSPCTTRVSWTPSSSKPANDISTGVSPPTCFRSVQASPLQLELSETIQTISNSMLKYLERSDYRNLEIHFRTWSVGRL